MLQFACPKCGASLSAPEKLQGAQARCSRCRSAVLVPAAAPLLEVLPAAEPPRRRGLSRAWAISLSIVGVCAVFAVGVAGTVAVAFILANRPKDAAAFHAEYVNSGGGFNEQYGGKRVTVSGRVVNIEHSLGETVEQLGTTERGMFLVRFLSPADAERAAGCRSVVVAGRVTTADQGVLFLESSDLISGD